MRKNNFYIPVFLLLLLAFQMDAFSQDPWQRLRNWPSVLALDRQNIKLETPDFLLNLVSSSQTVASLQPKSIPGFDYTPGDSLRVRSGNGLYHIGDINLRVRMDVSSEWKSFSSAKDRHPVEPLPVSGNVLAAANLAPTFPKDIPLTIHRLWEIHDGQLVLKFEIKNTSSSPVEIGSVGFPLIFNNILTGTLDQAHAKNVFYDPYIGMDAGYLQVTRLTGRSSSLLVLPYGNTPFEAYNPLLDDPTPRSIIFEGFYEWMACSKAYAEKEWKDAQPWNQPSSIILQPGEEKIYGLQFVLSGEPSDIEKTLVAHKRPVATGVPGYVLPKDVKAKLFLNYSQKIISITSLPEGAISIKKVANKNSKNWKEYQLQGIANGRSALLIRYSDGLQQTIQYKVIKAESEVVDDYGKFLTTKQWFEEKSDTFHRSPSVISYDNQLKQQVVQENRAWIAGLSDEAGAGSWLGAIMKQLIVPDKTQVAKLERFVDNTLWGHIQYSEGANKYGVRKSLFYYEPALMPEGTYHKDINFKTWSAWPLKEANSVGRSYNYPHVTAAWWVMYRNARNYKGLVISHPWNWYLENAFYTAMAMVKQAPYYAQFGQMEGTIFYLVLKDLQAEGMKEMADTLEAAMKKRAIHWSTLKYPFGSEMPWDSTGQEEVYIWSHYFGFDEKADITLNAILGYMPSIPGWAYNGNTRRYWDFLYAGKLTRVERMIHHYGSALNAIPVLNAYRQHPDNFYLLKVGYGGYLGSIANIEEDGFAPTAFHAFPATLKNDAYTGDFGSGFFGHAINSATYLVNHADFGWLTFGGNLSQKKKSITVIPTTASRSAVYIAPEGLWIKVEAGSIQSFVYHPKNGEVEIILEKAGPYNPQAYLTLEFPGNKNGQEKYKLNQFVEKRGEKYIIQLSGKSSKVVLVKG